MADTYQYQDETGTTLYEVDRLEWQEAGKPRKSFRQYKIENGARQRTKGDARSVIWRLPEVLNSTGTVLIAEGEKTAGALLEHGFIATTCDGGAKNWGPAHSASLAGRDVIILPDNDEPGRAHGDAVAESLRDFANSIRILNLPDLPHKGDAFDWFAAGRSRDELVSLASRAPPVDLEEVITPIPVLSISHVMAMQPNE